MNWFGESWEAPVCRSGQRVMTPVGEQCAGCAKFIKKDDVGVRIPDLDLIPELAPGAYGFQFRATTKDWHLACFLRELGVEAR